MVKAVFFDIDDTLYDFMGTHRKTWPVVVAWCQEKLGLSPEELKVSIAKGQKIADDRSGRGYAVNHNRLIRFQCMLENIGKPVFPYAYEMYSLYWDTFIDQIVPFPGVQELMEALKQRGTYIGLGSNMTADIQYRKIMKLGLGSYIDGIVTSEEAGIEKPDRRLFELCAQKAGVKPEESIFIGDSVAHDVNGAQSAGMPVILYHPVLKEEDVTPDTGEMLYRDEQVAPGSAKPEDPDAGQDGIGWYQAERGKCPVITHFSQFFGAEKLLGK